METSEMDNDVEVTLETAVDALGPEEGENFMQVMGVVQNIMDDPQSMFGSQALILAAKLAAYRTKMGVLSQLYKTMDKSIINRRRKDIIFTMYNALEENINTLKLLGRIERQA